MQYNDIINNGSLVYQSQAGDKKLREWRIEERTCSVKFYNTEPLSQFDSIILRLIDSTESGKITREELGLTLGFDIANRSFGSKRYYKDSAEVSLFNKLLDSVMMWNLIIEESEDENTKDESLDISDSTEKNENVTEENHKKSNATKYIRLTRLGHKALDMNCKFSFFSGEKVVMSNVNKSEYLEDTENFPFFSSLGLYTEINHVESLNCYEPDDIDIDHTDDLINRLNLQSRSTTNIFEAQALNSWKYAVKYVNISLYRYNDELYPIIFKGDEVSLEATNILYRGQNEHLYNQKVKKALYYKLINNADSVINYNEIKHFEDELDEEDFELIIRDSRTEWSDCSTYEFIVSSEYCTENNWDIISKYCPVDVIMKHISDANALFDMVTISAKLPIPFIIANCARYKWNMNVVMSRSDITTEQAQELMLCDSNSNIEWDWETVKPYLDINFVLSNIEHLHVDFYNLTVWLPIEHYNLIVCNPGKNWNWQFFVNNSNTDLVINHIEQLKPYVGLYIGIILDRILTDSEQVKAIVQNDSFQSVLRSLKEEGSLISYNLGAKANYAWCDELIDYLEQSGILCWNSTEFSPGFAKYSFISWNSEFFNKYYHKITTAEDYSYVSGKISDLSLISSHSDFPWDWHALSCNKNFSSSEAFLELGRELVSYEEWMNNSIVAFTSGFFESHKQWMTSSKNVTFVSKSIKDYNVVLENPSYPWIWSVLAQNVVVANDKRFCDALHNHTDAIPNWILTVKPEIIEEYFDKLKLSEYINKVSDSQTSEICHSCWFALGNNIWDKLSQVLTPDFIYDNIHQRWNPSIVSRRLINLIEHKPEALDKCKNILKWEILSNELSETFIANYIVNFKCLWDWNILTNRLSAAYIYQHFKEYLDYWNKDVAVNKIIHLLKKEDIFDVEIAELLDWQVISEAASEELLFDILEEKKDVLNWDVVSKRICDYNVCDLSKIISPNNNVSECLNWNILSSHMALTSIINYRNLVGAKWDWSIITDRFETSYIIDNLLNYSSYWDWDIILDKKFNRDYIITNLHFVKEAISQLESSTKEKCWKTISCLYKPAELLLLSEANNPMNEYEWDYSYIYTAITDPELFVNQDHSYIDRRALSACCAVNKMFEYDSDTYVFRTWKTIVKGKLNNPKFEWDYSELTKQPSIQERNDVFYEINPDSWDWDYISEFGSCLLPEHKGKYLRKYKNRLNFSLISTREDIGIDNEMISNFIKEEWNWKSLSENKSVNLSFDFIFSLKEKPWDWAALSQNAAIKWDIKILRQILKTPEIKAAISWDDVIARKELSFDDTIIELMDDICFSWYVLTSNSSYKPSIATISKAIDSGEEINWGSLSSNVNINIQFVRAFTERLDWSLVTSNKNVINIENENVVDEFVDVLDWRYLSENIHLTTERLVKYKNKIDWKLVNERFNYSELDISYVDSIQECIDWTKLSGASIVFTEEFLHKYRAKIDWYAFSENKSVDFSADLYQDFAKELNVIKFLDKMAHHSSGYYNKMKVYHFSHMFNAIEIIKNRKIMSRNKAEETRSLKFDAAGSVVHRTGKAHPFARFYYRPKSMTQFYNECLGWDSSLETDYGKSYYSQACDLHLPKCPMPVFFEFDIREIVAKYPEKCYYSTGNLQTNAASVLKITETPDRLRLDYLYHDISDAKFLTNNYFGREQVSPGEWKSVFYDFFDRIKEQSQQEFLVEEELDFMQLESLRIICYDEFQKDLLINYLGDDEIVSKIEVDYRMYSHENRQLEMSENEDVISITSDYDINGCAYLLVKGGEIKNQELIKNRTSSGLIMYPSVVFDKHNPPSEVYLIDPNPRADTKEWLIYKS